MIGSSPFNGKTPRIHPTAFIAKDAVIIGDVEICAYASIWFGAIIRGDWGKIIVGENTSIQDNCVIHTKVNTVCKIGKNVTLGHLSIVHGPTVIGNSTLIGMGATVLQNSKIGEGVVVAAGAVIKGKAEDNGLYAGVLSTKKKTYPSKKFEKWGYNIYVDNSQKFKDAGLSHKIPKEYLMIDPE